MFNLLGKCRNSTSIECAVCGVWCDGVWCMVCGAVVCDAVVCGVWCVVRCVVGGGVVVRGYVVRWCVVWCMFLSEKVQFVTDV
jgi:hypothetical protein